MTSHYAHNWFIVVFGLEEEVIACQDTHKYIAFDSIVLDPNDAGGCHLRTP